MLNFLGKTILSDDIYRICVIQDPKFWTYRPLSEMMVRAAADDVRFLLYIYNKMMEKLSQRSMWHLAVRGALYCRCYCINDNDYADWPSLPPIPGLLTWNVILISLIVKFFELLKIHYHWISFNLWMGLLLFIKAFKIFLDFRF